MFYKRNIPNHYLGKEKIIIMIIVTLNKIISSILMEKVLKLKCKIA